MTPLMFSATYDADGFDPDGYDAQGYGRDGYDRQGFNRNGFDLNGNDRNGQGAVSAQRVHAGALPAWFATLRQPSGWNLGRPQARVSVPPMYQAY